MATAPKRPPLRLPTPQWRRSPLHAHDIMTREVIAIPPQATVQDAARILADYNISGMPVLDHERRMVGIVTEADIIGKEGASVADIMTQRVVSVREET